MTTIERLRAELALAEVCAELEDARGKMHAKATPASIAKYRDLSAKVVEARRDYRDRHRSSIEHPEGGGVASPDTVRARIEHERATGGDA